MGAKNAAAAAATGGTSAIAQGAADVATTLIGMIGQKKREQRQMGYQRELMGIQNRLQQNLNRQGADLQYEMWQKTNYPAQIEMMKEAGLNPGLLYGKGGAGGTTTGSQGGGSQAGGQAPQVPSTAMDIQNLIALKQQRANLKLIDAQIQATNAQANKSNAEASNLRGEKGTIGESTINLNLAQAEKLLEDKLNLTAQRQLIGLEYKILDAKGPAEIQKIYQEIDNLAANQKLTEEETNVAKQQVLAMGVKMKLDQANIKLSEQTAWKMTQDVIQRGVEIGIDAQKLGTMQEANIIRRLENDTETMNILKNLDLNYERLDTEQKKAVIQSLTQILIASQNNITKLLD